MRLRVYVHEEPNKAQRHVPIWEIDHIRLEIVWPLINWETVQTQAENINK